ncbi:CoA transferase [Streptomyces sp. L7]
MTADARRHATDLVDAALGEWTRTLPADVAAEALQAHGMHPAGAVQDGREPSSTNRRLRTRGFYVRKEHPVAGAFLHEASPIRLTGTPGAVREAAPVLGAPPTPY